MSTTWEIQRQLFEQIKDRVKDSQEWVKELEQVLHVSKDAVYRRLRGETLLNLEDLRLLATTYQVSIDQLIQTGLHTLVSDFQSIPTFSLEAYLAQMKSNFDQQNGQPITIYFNAKELPIFYLFQFPELLSFKYFFWTHTFLSQQGGMIRFQRGKLSTSSVELSAEILSLYSDIPSVELWSPEILGATFSQIRYYHELGALSDEDKEALLQDVLRLLDSLEQMTDEGKKTPGSSPAKVQVFLNEVLPGDNTLIVQSAEGLQAFLTQQVVNSVVVNDHAFCTNALSAITRLVDKSTLISASGERVRRRFFQKLREQATAFAKT